MDFLEGALRRFPDSAEIRLLYATILLEFRPDDVATEVARAIELDPDDPVILVRGASLLLNRGQCEAARLHVKRARQLVGADFVLEGGLANLEGLFAAFDKEHDFAEEKLRFAVEREPDLDSFARDLARFLQARGRQAEAMKVIDQALLQVKTKDNLERIRRELEEELSSA